MDTYAGILRNQGKYYGAWNKILKEEADKDTNMQSTIRRTRDRGYSEN